MATTFQELPSILKSCLPSNDLTLQVNQSGSHLSVVINRPITATSVNYEEIAEQLITKIRTLKLPNVQSVKLYGRPAKSKQVEWQASHSLLIEDSNPFDAGLSHSKTAVSQASTPTASAKPAKSSFQTYLEQFSYYSNVISAASLLGLLLLLGFNTLAGQKTQIVTYEYKIDSIPDSSFTETMNQLGTEGWELTFARRAQDSTTETFSYECIFKRQKK